MGTNQMRALMKEAPGAGLVMTDVPVPELGPHDVLIRVKKSAICGTDLHIWNWDDWSAATVPTPMVVGHEFMGEVVDVGNAVQRVKRGDRVAGEGHITCGKCRNCRAGRGHLCRYTVGVGVHRQGAFADYLSLPEHNVVVLPESVPDEVAAIFDPFGNAVHTALSFDLVGEDVLVTGAGPIGIMAAMVAARAGARHVVITDIVPYRLELARQLVPGLVVDVSKEDLRDAMAGLGMTEGFDVGLEMSGAEPAIRQMIDVMNNGGKLALLGITPRDVKVGWNTAIFKMLTLKGIYGREMFETWYKMIALVEGGLDLTPLITHRLPVTDFAKGFAAMNAGESGKVILDWL